MKPKKDRTLTFRPSKMLRERLERLSAATGHTITHHITKAIENSLPAIEQHYQRELAELPLGGTK